MYMCVCFFSEAWVFTWNLLQPSQPALSFWEMFRKRNDNTDLLTQRVTCLCVSAPGVFTYSGNFVVPYSNIFSCHTSLFSQKHTLPRYHCSFSKNATKKRIAISKVSKSLFFALRLQCQSARPKDNLKTAAIHQEKSTFLRWATICCMFECGKPYKSLHSGSWRESKEHCISYSTSVTFHTEGNIPVSLHVFVFILIVEQDIAFIHDAVFFFLHVCAFCVITGAFRT